MLAFQVVVLFAFISLFLYVRRQQKSSEARIQRLDQHLFQVEKLVWQLQDKEINN